jgi:hypothetical protein
MAPEIDLADSVGVQTHLLGDPLGIVLPIQPQPSLDLGYVAF